MPVKRNILLILTSGHRGDGLGASGAWPIQTPALDAIASNGLALTAISPSPEPAAARRAVFSGLHPRQQSAADVAAGRMDGWAKAFADAGWFIAGAGCVGPIATHLVESRCVADVDQLRRDDCAYLRWADKAGLIERVEAQRAARRRTGPFEPADPFEHPDDDVDGFVATSAAAMVGRLPKDEPWLMVAAFTGPGNDLPAPRMYRELIDPRQIDQPFVMPDLRELDRYARLDHPRTLLQRLSPTQLDAIRANYLARVCMIDFFVASLRHAIDRAGLARNTWVVLSSDRGCLLGERGLTGVTSFLGSGAYVPLWVLPPTGVGDRHAAADRDRRDQDGLVSGGDLCATLCDIAGVDPPPACTGRSVLPALAGGTVGRPAVISEFDHRLLIETLRHKATYDTQTTHLRALFDMVNDPGEKHDLAGTPCAADVSDSLKWRLADVLMQLSP